MIVLAKPTPKKIASPSQALLRVSQRLEELQDRLAESFGIETIYIGAGSALAILDHCFQGKELVMRDLDIFACLNGTMTESIAVAMGTQLESEVIGRFSRHDVRPRRRGNPNLPMPAAFDYNAGYGFFMIDEDGEILDLTVFHTQADMLLNGIMNVDKVRIRLDHGTSLIEQLRPLFETQHFTLDELGVEDPHGGYRCWQAGTAELVNEFDVRRAPLETILRIIRTFAKFSVPSISAQTRNRLANLLADAADDSQAFYTIRGLIKMLSDRNAVWELNLLREIGGLRKIGGIARQQLERLFWAVDRFGSDANHIRRRLKSTANRLAEIEHQMKLQGVA